MCCWAVNAYCKLRPRCGSGSGSDVGGLVCSALCVHMGHVRVVTWVCLRYKGLGMHVNMYVVVGGASGGVARGHKTFSMSF